ncbi:hypothetical protein MJI95_34840, partial [Salmonella enterica subsp. enterica serovar Kentucky]|nr:hypothetical protein [Salmonella enterica subsp. enterica serovar Kentucky]
FSLAFSLATAIFGGLTPAISTALVKLTGDKSSPGWWLMCAAFMPTYELSEALAEAIVGVANGAGVRTTALLTDMNQVLASSAGNAVEVREAVQFLTGEYRNPRLF